ncbi:hypothetical protein [Ekhidna sp.]|uniref:hypothetical protein n=1 Tax=Ekhidna sp. TaxID=2608089 RepID=UPI003CCB95D7
MKKIIEHLHAEWYKYLLEILVITIGILGAFALNNWNENRKVNDQKNQLFKELHSRIRSDTTNMKWNLKNLEKAKNSAELLKMIVKNDEPYTQGLDTALAQLDLVSSMESDYTAFDRLNSVGIEIIDDDSLKNEIIHYYQDSKSFVDIPISLNDLLGELYPKYFTSYHYAQNAKPADFEQLKNLNEFRIALDYTVGISSFLIQRTNHRKVVGAGILKMIENESNIDFDAIKSPYQKSAANDSTILNRLNLMED